MRAREIQHAGSVDSFVTFSEVFETLEFDLVGYQYGFQIDGINFSIVVGEAGFELYGRYSTKRSVGTVDYRLPATVASHELGLALLAYGLRSVPLSNPPEWLLQGRALTAMLPWEVALRAYEERPSCSVERAWMRVAGPKLEAMGTAPGAEERTEVRFDGEIVRFASGELSVVMPGNGAAWTEVYCVATTSLPYLRQ